MPSILLRPGTYQLGMTLGAVDLYQGVPALGGGLQVLFMLTSNEGGGESAAGRERGGRARRH